VLKYLAGFPLLWALIFAYSSCESYSVPKLDGVTKIVVTNTRGETLKEINDPEKIAVILGFVNNYPSGWGKPFEGVPVPRVTANFYSGKDFVGHFGADKGFFETHRRGDFYSRQVSPQEVRSFLTLIDLDEKEREALRL
jgi:hypothetical protein